MGDEPDTQRAQRVYFTIFILLSVVAPIGWSMFVSWRDRAQAERFGAYLDHLKCVRDGDTVVGLTEGPEPREVIHAAFDCHDGEVTTLHRFKIMEEVMGMFENGEFLGR